MIDEITVFIVCDAVRWDYLNPDDTPFILGLANSGIYCRKLKPSLGFCERIEMFTGAPPKDTGYFTALTFDRTRSDFCAKLMAPKYFVLNMFTILQDFLSSVRPLFGDIFGSVLVDRLIVNRLIGSSQPIYNIPLPFLRDIALTEDYHEMNERNSQPVETLYDILANEEICYLYDTFASLRVNAGHSDDLRIEKFLAESTKRDYKVLLLYLGEGDAIGHHFGPDSIARRKMMRKLDCRIGTIVKELESRYKKVSFLIIGDHGMVGVHKHLDASKLLSAITKKNGLTSGKDFKYFLDSTMIRLWFNNEKSKEAFTSAFKNSKLLREFGKFLDANSSLSFNLPSNLTYYGDLIWLANPGVVVFPDFFHRAEKVRGMHGYDPTIDQQKGFAVIYSNYKKFNGQIEEGNLIDICPTLCELIGVSEPKSNSGKSLIER